MYSLLLVSAALPLLSCKVRESRVRKVITVGYICTSTAWSDSQNISSVHNTDYNTIGTLMQLG